MYFSAVYMPYLIYKWMRDAYNWDARISGVNAWSQWHIPCIQFREAENWLEDLLDPGYPHQFYGIDQDLELLAVGI
jgi:hypothetical protein